MAKSDNWKPRSLVQHFEAPDDYAGEFGWIVGYSADAPFLNDAAERFSRRTRGGRAFEGKVRLALLLDPGNPQILPADVPGVLHLPLKAESKQFHLLHAKVALLGFRHNTERENWLLRLVVSTGNWTGQTLEESLDLAWAIEIDSEEVPGPHEHDLKLRCADFRAAWECIGFLQPLFDIRALTKAAEPLAGWMGSIPWQRGWPKPRFIDNRERSLLDQLPEMVKRHGRGVARNHISMGSGFYERSTNGEVPSVPRRIVEQLKEERLLTESAEVRIFVNRDACQAVADAAEAIHKNLWWICDAGSPEHVFGKRTRSLHAKFLFSANYQNGSNKCSSAWVYIGSGNLTGPGFASARSKSNGNLEAGVVFAPSGLEWYPRRGIEPEILVTNLLPVQWDAVVEEVAVLIAGGDMPDRDDAFIAPPVAWLDWRSADGDEGGWLSIPAESDDGPFDVLHGGTPCQQTGREYRWPGGRPRQVEVRWVKGMHTGRAIVPVRDEYGLMATARLPGIEIADAWLQLASFPMPPEDEDTTEDDEEGVRRTSNNTAPQARGESANYPIRRMMELVENIADKQTAISEVDWTSWLCRLEQTLNQMSDCGVLNEFRKLALNPLAPLLEPSFRPSFAEDATTEAGRRYEDALARIESKWGMVNMKRLGAVL